MHTAPFHRTTACRAAVLLAAAFVCGPASAAVTTSGAVSLFPNPGVPFGPGDMNLPDTQLSLGSGRRQASFAADAGSQVTLAYFNFSGDGLDTSTALLTGQGTVLRLAAPGNTNRFGLGNVGRASMVVSAGAVLDGRHLRERCDSGNACQNAIAAAAGSHGSLTVTGAGSEAHFIRMFHLASLSYNSAAGRRGQDALGTLQVLAGGVLSTELPIIGAGFTGTPLDGTERAIVQVKVAGTGSRWEVLGSPFSGGAVQLSAALDRQAIVQFDIEQDGVLHVMASPAGAQSRVQLGTGGQFDGRIAGAGSQLRIDGDGSNGVLIIGSNAGQSTLRVTDGALLRSRIATVHVGLGDGNGALRIDGAGSVADLGTARVLVGDFAATSGTGWLQVTGGAVLQAGRVEIAPRGLLSGSGTVNALVINAGTVNPGDSPGTLTLAGGFTNATGGRLVLEVESDGAGGFVTDRLVFLGAAPTLDALQVSFRFLGATDPNAFQASGLFGLGQFLRVGEAPIAPQLLANASFNATSDAYTFTSFSFTPTGGAAFNAVPVPEPATWLMLLAGAALLVARGRR